VPTRVALYHIEPDASLADGITDALIRRELPIELHRGDIDDAMTALPEYYDAIVLTVTNHNNPNLHYDKIRDLRDRFRTRRMAIATDFALNNFPEFANVPVISLDDWRGDEFDPRIDVIVGVIEHNLAKENLSSYWTDNSIDGDRSDELMRALITPVRELELSVRTSVILKNENIVYVGDIVQRTEAEWLRTPNFGRKSLNEIKETLSSLNLWLGMDTPTWPPPNIEREIARRAAARRVSDINQERLGLTFEASSDFLLVDASGDQSDHEAAERPVVKQLHAEIIRKARHFASVAPRLDNQLGWQGMSPLCDRLVSLINRPIEEIPDVVGLLYSAALEVGSFYELDVSIKNGGEAYAAPLEAEVRRPLEDLVRSLAPWLRSFPTIKELDDEAGQFLIPPSNLDAPDAVVRAADETSLISEEDSEALKGLLSAARRGEFQGSKAGHRGRLSVRNMVIAVAGVFSGLILSDYGGKSVLVGKAGTFLSHAEAGIIELVADLPVDIRAAIEIILAEHQGSPAIPAHAPRPSSADRAKGMRKGG
jgi:hypothetical protein